MLVVSLSHCTSLSPLVVARELQDDVLSEYIAGYLSSSLFLVTKDQAKHGLDSIPLRSGHPISLFPLAAWVGHLIKVHLFASGNGQNYLLISI